MIIDKAPLTKFMYWWIKLTYYPFGVIYIMFIGINEFMKLHTILFDMDYDEFVELYKEQSNDN